MKSIAIEREFGSGGREIGILTAKLAGIPYYDGELLKKAARDQGVPVSMLEYYDEKRSGSLLYDLSSYVKQMQLRHHRPPALLRTSEDHAQAFQGKPRCLHRPLCH